MANETVQRLIDEVNQRVKMERALRAKRLAETDEHGRRIWGKRRNIRPTALRRLSASDHRPPANGEDNTGGPWKGTKRVRDRRARRAQMARLRAREARRPGPDA